VQREDGDQRRLLVPLISGYEELVIGGRVDSFLCEDGDGVAISEADLLPNARRECARLGLREGARRQQLMLRTPSRPDADQVPLCLRAIPDLQNLFERLLKVGMKV
jgi:hypothetical protein